MAIIDRNQFFQGNRNYLYDPKKLEEVDEQERTRTNEGLELYKEYPLGDFLNRAVLNESNHRWEDLGLPSHGTLVRVSQLRPDKKGWIDANGRYETAWKIGKACIERYILVSALIKRSPQRIGGLDWNYRLRKEIWGLPLPEGLSHLLEKETNFTGRLLFVDTCATADERVASGHPDAKISIVAFSHFYRLKAAEKALVGFLSPKRETPTRIGKTEPIALVLKYIS